jgi:hypothetical protein
MVGGIIAVGIIVYLGLSALSTNDSPTTTRTSASSSTTSTPATTTTRATTTTVATTTTSSTSTTSTTVPLQAPGEIQVLVLNAEGTAGLAAEVSSGLRDLGYQTLEPTNYRPLLSQTRVWYAEGFEGEAFVLAAEFPDALVESMPADFGDAEIVVVLGESYQG